LTRQPDEFPVQLQGHRDNVRGKIVKAYDRPLAANDIWRFIELDYGLTVYPRLTS
jgi:hypothetical protein